MDNPRVPRAWAFSLTDEEKVRDSTTTELAQHLKEAHMAFTLK